MSLKNVSNELKERLASLVLSTVNSTDNVSSNSTKTALEAASPFVLDASNTTQTQFFLVINEGETPPATLNETNADSSSANIKVTLRVPVFEPAEASMRSYCATFDPNPPTPAPLRMERCFTEGTTANSSFSLEHRSQTFTYSPSSGIVAPLWSFASNSATSGDVHDKQMNFELHNVIKDGALPTPVLNATQAINGTTNGTTNGTATPVPPAIPSPVGDSTHNVTLVFSPVGPAVHSVSAASDAASFEPADNDDSREDEPDDSTSNNSEVNSLSTTDLVTSSMPSSTTTDDCLSTATDSQISMSATPSDFAEMDDVMSTSGMIDSVSETVYSKGSRVSWKHSAD